MPSGDGKWTELSSQNERVVGPGDPAVLHPARADWAELASSRERLIDSSDPLFPAAGGSHGRAGMRLVASAA